MFNMLDVNTVNDCYKFRHEYVVWNPKQLLELQKGKYVNHGI